MTRPSRNGAAWVGLGLALAGMLVGAALWVGSVHETARASYDVAQDHEQRLRIVERAIVEVGADVQIIRNILEKGNRDEARLQDH